MGKYRPPGPPSDQLAVREAGFARLTCDEDGNWVSAVSLRSADGSLLYEVGDVLQEPEAFSWVIVRSSSWNRE